MVSKSEIDGPIFWKLCMDVPIFNLKKQAIIDVDLIS